MRRSGSKLVHGAGRPARSRTDPAGGDLFLREGDYWTVVYDGTVLRLRDGKGLRYLAALLQRPGEPIAALDLRTAIGADALGAPSLHVLEAPLDPEHARIAVTKRIKEAIRKIAAHHAALGYHLEAAIRTGVRCAYAPDPARPPLWRVELEPEERVDQVCIPSRS
jgi:hypothetical protein